MDMKKASFAGSFYEADPVRLSNDIKSYLAQAKKVVSKKPRAIIVPHAGYMYSGSVAAFGYKQLEGYMYNKIVIIGPSHRSVFNGMATIYAKAFETPLGNVPVFNNEGKHQGIEVIPEAFSMEHNIEVQLPFLQSVLNGFKIFPILTGYIDKNSEEFIKIDNLLDDITLLVVSSDLSHYLPYEQCKSIDSKTLNLIETKSPQITQEQACGAAGLNILLKIAKKRNWMAKFLKYTNSGDITGDKFSVVGYTSFVFI